MKDVQKYAFTIALTAAGVIAGGYALYEFRDNKFIAKARNGFQGIV